MATIVNYRGKFELLPFSGKVLIGEYYYVDYNLMSHASAPTKMREIVKVLKFEYHNEFYVTDRGTWIKDYCILNYANKVDE